MRRALREWRGTPVRVRGIPYRDGGSLPTGLARFARIRNGLPHFAEVALSVEVGSAGFRCESRVDPRIPDDWARGAAAGAAFACVEAGAPGGSVVVERITGMLTDTNPTIVAAAAAMATWKALRFVPQLAVLSRIEAACFESWGHPDEVPDWRNGP